ncbi:hypothetical protein ccbrp13_31740 [Ktedonobacteria bacterium brp13]|nr:hypothetical protein ccbrp13_31740 [Ktedonobacteria bacterium brp13]
MIADTTGETPVSDDKVELPRIWRVGEEKFDILISGGFNGQISTDLYQETREGWLYLAGVIDAYSRKIVGWSMSEHHDAELVHHSDRGSEYASSRYQTLLREHHIQVNMSKKGDGYDNAMIESFWATLKEECSKDIIFPSRNEAKTAVFEYIEVYYN